MAQFPAPFGPFLSVVYDSENSLRAFGCQYRLSSNATGLANYDVAPLRGSNFGSRCQMLRLISSESEIIYRDYSITKQLPGTRNELVNSNPEGASIGNSTHLGFGFRFYPSRAPSSGTSLVFARTRGDSNPVTFTLNDDLSVSYSYEDGGLQSATPAGFVLDRPTKFAVSWRGTNLRILIQKEGETAIEADLTTGSYSGGVQYIDVGVVEWLGSASDNTQADYYLDYFNVDCYRDSVTEALDYCSNMRFEQVAKCRAVDQTSARGIFRYYAGALIDQSTGQYPTALRIAYTTNPDGVTGLQFSPWQSFSHRLNLETSGADSDPGVGTIRLVSATQINISKTSLEGVDISSKLQSLIESLELAVADPANQSNLVKYRMTADPIDRTTYYEFTVEQTFTRGTVTSGLSDCWINNYFWLSRWEFFNLNSGTRYYYKIQVGTPGEAPVYEGVQREIDTLRGYTSRDPQGTFTYLSCAQGMAYTYPYMGLRPVLEAIQAASYRSPCFSMGDTEVTYEYGPITGSSTTHEDNYEENSYYDWMTLQGSADYYESEFCRYVAYYYHMDDHPRSNWTSQHFFANLRPGAATNGDLATTLESANRDIGPFVSASAASQSTQVGVLTRIAWLWAYDMGVWAVDKYRTSPNSHYIGGHQGSFIRDNNCLTVLVDNRKDRNRPSSNASVAPTEPQWCISKIGDVVNCNQMGAIEDLCYEQAKQGVRQFEFISSISIANPDGILDRETIQGLDSTSYNRFLNLFENLRSRYGASITWIGGDLHDGTRFKTFTNYTQITFSGVGVGSTNDVTISEIIDFVGNGGVYGQIPSIRRGDQVYQGCVLTRNNGLILDAYSQEVEGEAVQQTISAESGITYQKPEISNTFSLRF